MTFGQGQGMTANTLTPLNSVSCLHLPTFMSQAEIGSEKSTVFSFSYRKAYVTKFDFTVRHFLLDCADFDRERLSCFQVNNLKDLFTDVSVENILSFLKVVNRFNKI